MQTELFPASMTDKSVGAAPKKPARATSGRALPERTVVAEGVVFDSWVSYPARTVNAVDGLRVEFSVPVHQVLVGLVPAEKTEILCKYRVRKGFAWGGLGRKALVRVEGDLCAGPRGGHYLHCREVVITEPHPIKGEMLSKSMMRKLEKRVANETKA